ncbi:MAG: hypothetical protein AAF517_11830, partial [Planctomycetota bacterium]
MRVTLSILMVLIGAFAVPQFAQIGSVAEEISVRPIWGDDGDGDGFIDTRESAQLFLEVTNRTAVPQDLLIEIALGLPAADCIGASTFLIEQLAAAETRTVGPVSIFGSLEDRTALGLSAEDSLTFEFEVRAFGIGKELRVAPAVIRVDRDLDVTLAGSPTSYAESFESGFGSMQPNNMDLGLDSLATADGYRCQTHDPDNPESFSFGFVFDCFLGPTGVGTTPLFWQIDGASVPESQAIDGGRAFDGTHALYWGIFDAPASVHTTPFGVLESAELSDPIHVGAGGLCSGGGGVSCSDALDCPVGESCDPLRPELRFRHQVNFYEYRPGLFLGKGVFQIQPAHPDGSPAGPWRNAEPYYNSYDEDSFVTLPQCFFDPIDDGSNEDDLFDPLAIDGPSSLCRGTRVWARAGNPSVATPFL